MQESRLKNNELQPTETEPAKPSASQQSGPGKGKGQRQERISLIKQRRRARKAALQVLYEIDCVGHQPRHVLDTRVHNAHLEDEGLRFLRWLVSGVVTNREQLDIMIAKYAPEWPVDQLAVVDRNILRLALFELGSASSDAPEKVIINEAVELAKTFGSDSSPRFVNGVLGTALRNFDQKLFD
jgi:N utilization substance protein B